MPNVKVGDLAVVKNAERYNGRLFEIVGKAPNGKKFRLPNGKPHIPILGGRLAWVVKAIGGPVLAEFADNINRETWYAVGDDRFLWPLPGSTKDESVEQTTECPLS